MILTAQLAVTAAIVAPLALVDEAKRFLQAHMFLMYLAMAGYLVCIIVLACFRNLGRKYPHNYIILGILTVGNCGLLLDGICIHAQCTLASSCTDL